MRGPVNSSPRGRGSLQSASSGSQRRLTETQQQREGLYLLPDQMASGESLLDCCCPNPKTESPSLWTPLPFPMATSTCSTSPSDMGRHEAPDPRGKRLELFRRPASERGGHRPTSTPPGVVISRGHAEFIKSMVKVLDRSCIARQNVSEMALMGSSTCHSRRQGLGNRSGSGGPRRGNSHVHRSLYGPQLMGSLQGMVLLVPPALPCGPGREGPGRLRKAATHRKG